jgi:hypothetical protein
MDDELTGKLEGLRIAHDVEHIDFLVLKLKKSSYVSMATRSRIINLISHEPQTPALVNLQKVFSKSTANYIPRANIREVIQILQEIQHKLPSTFPDKSSWTKEEWFCQLVDSDTIVSSLLEILNTLEVCRHNVISSIFTIVLFGLHDDAQFFQSLMEACSKDEILRQMNENIARSIFKYYGGVVIEGSTDCAHLMAGNNMKTVHKESDDGTVGGFFKFKDQTVSVTAAHVVPRLNVFRLNEEDVAFVNVDSSVQSVLNQLFIAHDSGKFDNFRLPEKFPFPDGFLHSLEAGY